MQFELRPWMSVAMMVGATVGATAIMKGMYCAMDGCSYDDYDRNQVEAHKRFVYGMLWPLSAGLRALTQSSVKEI